MAAKEKRKLKDLNLLDKFLFDEAMEDEENMKTLLDIILGQNTHLKTGWQWACPPSPRY